MNNVDRMMESLGYEKKSNSSSGMVFMALLMGLIAVAVIVSIPDLKRYMKIRAM